jgi:hypothetical protein
LGGVILLIVIKYIFQMKVTRGSKEKFRIQGAVFTLFPSPYIIRELSPHVYPPIFK